MYIIKNAWKSITRNKARNILIGIVALVIAVSSCVALSIRQAAETAKENTMEGMSVTAQISFDRASQMSNQMSDMKNSGTFDKGSFDFNSIKGETLTLDDYMTYTKALSDGDTYYYNMTASLDATDGITAYNSTSSDTNAQSNMMMGGKGGAMVAQGDFSLTGYSSYNAMLSLFGSDGSCSISDGAMFDENSEALTCVISDELAVYNDLSVGDTIVLANPNDENDTYTLTICGIYTNSMSDAGNSSFAQTDPANNIYMSYNALNSIVEKSNDATALTSEIAFTYVFSEVDHYYSFETGVYELGLSDTYTVSSMDITAYESSLTPLETLSSMAGWFFVIVLLIGGVILIVLNIFNLRERKYEVGVLTAIGMKKGKVALQFVYELFSITFVAIILGAVIGATVSVPVTNVLLANQAESATNTTQELSNNFGRDMSQMKGGTDMANVKNGFNAPSEPTSYITSVTSATNIWVILELIGVGIFLTVVSSLAAMITIMRYEPLKILSSRS